MVAAALALQAAIVWLPAAASVALSVTTWDGIGSPFDARVVGLGNYAALFASTPRFWSAVLNNGLWLVAYLGVALPVGVVLAWLLDRRLRGARLYQAAFYLPVLLSLALVGFVWQLQYAPDQGFLNNALGRTGPAAIDWLGDRSLNRWSVLVAGVWRQVGYVMVVYLAGLRTVDPALRDAAAIDGATEWQAFRRVVLPALRPITTVALVISAIDAVRMFDLPYVLNGGVNGIETLGTLVTSNLATEASRIGFGSAVATILLLVSVPPIALFVRRRFREAAP